MKKTISTLAPVVESRLAFPHFPTKMQTFIFRNWDIVPANRIAACLGCSVSEVEKQAYKMGLKPQKDVSCWLTRGYISIIKANWALLPYEQLLTILGWDEEKLGMVLKDEDFLKFKLGDIKPLCDKIEYRELTAEEEVITEKIRKTIEEKFLPVDDAKDAFEFFSVNDQSAGSRQKDNLGSVIVDSSWGIVDEMGNDVCARIVSRFKKQFESDWKVTLDGNEKHITLRLFDEKKEEEYHEIEITSQGITITGADSAAILRGLVYLEDIAKARGTFSFEPCTLKRKARFKTRIIYSFCGLYNDALDTDSKSWCPDLLLENYSKNGINGIWIQGILYRLAHFPFEPSLSSEMEKRLERLNELIERCADYGIKVFLYFNEPRAMEEAFFEKHPAIMGAKRRTLRCMCSSAPEVSEYVSSAIESICKSASGLGGIFVISSSENLNNCRAWTMDEECPRCSNRPMSEIASQVCNCISEAAHRVNPDIKVIIWDWGWRRPELMDGTELEKYVKALEPRSIVMSGRERGIPIVKGGIQGEIEDYTLCVTGVGEMAKDAWKWARETNHETAAKLQINNSWECSTIPYLPLFRTVETIVDDVAREGVEHLMLSWTLGGAPSPNIKVISRKFFDTFGADSADDDILASIYGKDAAVVKKATDILCDAFSEFPFAHQGIYTGPANGGAANLLYEKATGFKATMTCFAYDDIDTWRCQYPEDVYEKQFEKMSDMWLDGLKLLEATDACELKDMAEAVYIQLRSGTNQIKFVRARNKGDHSQMVKLAKDEIPLAVKLWTLMEKYPQIGFEAANHYYYTKGMLMEKVINCQYIIDKYSE